MSEPSPSRDRTLLRLAVGAVVVLFVLVPVRGADAGDPWTVTLALAAAIATVGLFGAIVLVRSPPAPDDGEPPPPSEGG